MKLSDLINRLLVLLYKHNKSSPYDYIDLASLSDELSATLEQLSLAAEHLDKLGLVDAEMHFDGGVARITSDGIIFIEDQETQEFHNATQSTIPNSSMRDPRSVFIIQGRNQVAARQLKLFLQSLGLQELTFEEAAVEAGNNASIFEIVNFGVSRTKAVIALFTPDERAVLQQQFAYADDKQHDWARWQARPNVIYEAGLALALNREGTILVTFGNVVLPSDLAGIKVVKLDNHIKCRKELRDKLERAGCSLNDSSGAWMSEEQGGDFSPALVEPGELTEIIFKRRKPIIPAGS